MTKAWAGIVLVAALVASFLRAANSSGRRSSARLSSVRQPRKPMRRIAVDYCAIEASPAPAAQPYKRLHRGR